MSRKSCCVGSLVVLLVVLAGLWLYSISSDVGRDDYLPKCTIEEIYVPALNIASHDATDQTINTAISFDLRLKIETPYMWEVYYDSFIITLYYYGRRDAVIRRPVGYVSILKFRQSTSEEEPRNQLVNVWTVGVPWEEAKMVVSNGGGTTLFGVELASRVRYEMHLPRGVTHKESHTVKLGVNVTVNDRGTKSVPGGLRFTSASWRISNPASV